MLTDVRSLTEGQPCAILGVGHTAAQAAFCFTNTEFILNEPPKQHPGALSLIGRHRMFHEFETKLGRQVSQAMLVERAAAKFVETTGIETRQMWPGTAADLGIEAARRALADARIDSSQIDAIIVGTNTGTGYASTADHIKLGLGAPIAAQCVDMQEACSIGGIILEFGWEKIRRRRYRHVLVVGSEKATTLASPDDYKAANLFGDAAFAMVLGPADRDDFIFFDSGSDPYDEKIGYIERKDGAFTQKGGAVMKYVAKVVPGMLDNIFKELKIDPATVHHFFPHQPSVRVLDVLMESLRKQWPSFNATVHQNIEEMGNTSGACTGWMISRAKARGELKPGEFCLVATFGSGMSWGVYGFIVR